MALFCGKWAIAFLWEMGDRFLVNVGDRFLLEGGDRFFGWSVGSKLSLCRKAVRFLGETQRHGAGTHHPLPLQEYIGHDHYGASPIKYCRGNPPVVAPKARMLGNWGDRFFVEVVAPIAFLGNGRSLFVARGRSLFCVEVGDRFCW